MSEKANLYESDSLVAKWELFGIKSYNQIDFIIDYQTYSGIV